MKNYKILKILIVFIVAYLAVPVVKDFFLNPSIGSGEAVKSFSGTLADGSTFNLTDLKGRYVLLDFWGSWCGPCIGEMPQMKGLHEKLSAASFKNANGFTIVSVAVEKDENRWRRALAKLDMPWNYQLMDKAQSLKFFDSPIAKQYGVKQVPTKFLINENGVVIGVNQSFEEITAFLEGEKRN